MIDESMSIGELALSIRGCTTNLKYLENKPECLLEEIVRGGALLRETFSKSRVISLVDWESKLKFLVPELKDQIKDSRHILRKSIRII